VFASRFTPIDSTLIPTGELRPVVGSPFDFRAPARIGARIGQADEQLAYAHGYDHNFVLDRPTSDNLVSCARLHEAGSGRVLEVLTTEPGLQLYTGQSLDARRPGSHGRAYGPHAGLTLETQHFPDSPHQPTFPSTLLRPGAAYRSRTVFRFLVR
jgi:aldose 1-epimerase